MCIYDMNESGTDCTINPEWILMNTLQMSEVDGKIQNMLTKRAPTSFKLATFMKISVGSEVHF